MRSNEVPPRLADVFHSHSLIVHGVHSEKGFDSVGIAVHDRWQVAKTFRMPASGRLQLPYGRASPSSLLPRC